MSFKIKYYISRRELPAFDVIISNNNIVFTFRYSDGVEHSFNTISFIGRDNENAMSVLWKLYWADKRDIVDEIIIECV